MEEFNVSDVSSVSSSSLSGESDLSDEELIDKDVRR